MKKAIGILVLGLVLLAGWTWVALHWSFSTGERAGYVQKFSRRGWFCKTWEGEMALVSMPGTVAEKFYFSVPDETVAEAINESVGRRVSLSYRQHIGIPTTCFGDTQYFVDGVQVIAGGEFDQLAPGAASPDAR
jgi:hypothetical protein